MWNSQPTIEYYPKSSRRLSGTQCMALALCVWQFANLLARVLLGLVYAFTSVQTHLLVEEYSPMHCNFCSCMVFIQDFQL